MTEDRDLEDLEKKYGHLVVVAFCSLQIVAVIIIALTSHWFNQRLLSDFWPVDKSSIAPNILASVIIFDVVTLAAALFYPPVKKALDDALTFHKEDLKKHVSDGFKGVHDRFDSHDARFDNHERMLRHVIENSDIPPLPEGHEKP